jgi:hypothetical protein
MPTVRLPLTHSSALADKFYPTILFSVIVLRWVTSKDSSSTSSSAHSKNTNKFGPCSGYGKQGYKNLGTVTTYISAMKNGKDTDEEDVELGSITVQIGQVVEVEEDADRDEGGGVIGVLRTWLRDLRLHEAYKNLHVANKGIGLFYGERERTKWNHGTGLFFTALEELALSFMSPGGPQITSI